MATAVEIQISRSGYYLRPNELFVPVEEYLRAVYRPDMDYVDGHLEERNVGEAEHSRLQLILSAMLALNEEAWGVLTYPDCRLQVKDDRYRVPDLLVLPVDQAAHRIVRTPPLLCIEILCPKTPSSGFSTASKTMPQWALAAPGFWTHSGKTSSFVRQEKSTGRMTSCWWSPAHRSRSTEWNSSAASDGVWRNNRNKLQEKRTARIRGPIHLLCQT